MPPQMAENPCRLPDFLLIGEMKCGTTTLWDLLVRHPDVFAPAQKELHFFASYSYFGGSGGAWPADIGPYAAHFDAAGPGQLCGEATPNYLFDLFASERIQDVAPRAKLVVILRDPVPRAWSHYWHQVRRGWERLGFEAALESEPSRMTESFDARDKFSYVSRGRYLEGLLRFENDFSRDQLLVVFLDDLHRDLPGTMQTTWRHLGLDPLAEADLAVPHHNRAFFPRWAPMDRFTRRSMRWARRSGGVVENVARVMSRATRSWRTYSGQPRMPDEIRGRLKAEFEQSDRALEEWLGRPLPWRAERVFGAASRA